MAGIMFLTLKILVQKTIYSSHLLLNYFHKILICVGNILLLIIVYFSKSSFKCKINYNKKMFLSNDQITK